MPIEPYFNNNINSYTDNDSEFRPGYHIARKMYLEISPKYDEACKFDERCIVDLEEAKTRIRLMRQFTLDMMNDRTRVTVDLHLLQEKYWKLEEFGHDAHIHHKAVIKEKEKLIEEQKFIIRTMKIGFEQLTEGANNQIEELQKKVDELSTPAKCQKRRRDSWCDS